MESQRGLLSSRNDDFESSRHDAEGMEMSKHSGHGASKRSSRQRTPSISSDASMNSSAHSGGSVGQKPLVSHKKTTSSALMSSSHHKQSYAYSSAEWNSLPDIAASPASPPPVVSSPPSAAPATRTPISHIHSPAHPRNPTSRDGSNVESAVLPAPAPGGDDGDKVANLKRRAERLEKMRKGDNAS
jgi:hypothetical protein